MVSTVFHLDLYVYYKKLKVTPFKNSITILCTRFWITKFTFYQAENTYCYSHFQFFLLKDIYLTMLIIKAKVKYVNPIKIAIGLFYIPKNYYLFCYFNYNYNFNKYKKLWQYGMLIKPLFDLPNLNSCLNFVL